MKQSVPLILVSAILLATPSLAQWTEKYPPASSPYWWTLTDEISPQELRQQHRKSAKRERYIEAQKQGRWSPLTEAELESILFFIDGSLTPELNRLTDVLGMLCFEIQAVRDPQSIQSDMASYGLSATEVELVFDACAARNTEIDEIQATNAEDVSRFVWLMERAYQAYSQEEYRKILRTRNFSKLARISEYSVPEVKRLSEVWAYEPIVDLDIKTSVFLKAELTQLSWERFRKYLYEARSPLVSEFELGDGELEITQ